MKKPTKRKRNAKVKKPAAQMHYVGRGVPRKTRPGMVLCHNHVRHTIDMPAGWHGFRAWFSDAPQPGFKKCGCGWSGLPHYSRMRNYKCETQAVIDSLM